MTDRPEIVRLRIPLGAARTNGPITPRSEVQLLGAPVPAAHQPWRDEVAQRVVAYKARKRQPYEDCGVVRFWEPPPLQTGGPTATEAPENAEEIRGPANGDSGAGAKNHRNAVGTVTAGETASPLVCLLVLAACVVASWAAIWLAIRHPWWAGVVLLAVACAWLVVAYLRTTEAMPPEDEGRVTDKPKARQ